MARILITGGSGYIGSHICAHLLTKNHTLLNIDIKPNKSLEPTVEYVECSILDFEKVNTAINKFKPEFVLHLAALVSVEESMTKPIPYYDVNAMAVTNILKAMHNNSVSNFIFASTAAVYSPNLKNLKTDFITEDHSLEPINTYGKSKLIAEKIVENMAKDLNINALVFRFFNAVGTDSDGEIGIHNKKPTTLLPRAILASLTEDKKFDIYGDDYDTIDGTAVRDFISVLDIADAHDKAIEFLKNKENYFKVLNLGSQTGVSVKQIVDKIHEILDVKLDVDYKKRRAGDAAKVVASFDSAFNTIGWKPSEDALNKAISNTYNWYKNKF